MTTRVLPILILVLSPLLGLTFPVRALAQDEVPPASSSPDEAPKDEAPKDEAPKDEAPKDEAPKDEAPDGEEGDSSAAEADAVTVEHPDELARVEKALARIEATRSQLRGSDTSLRNEKVEFRPEDISPQLTRREEVLGLTLSEAIESALTTNPDYLLALLDARIAAEGIPQARAAFDPTLSFTGTYAQARSPFFSTNPFTGLAPGLSASASRSMRLQTQVTQLLPTGTLLQLSYNEARVKTENVFSLNPSYTPSLSLSVTQPLLRGRGLDVNLAALRNARNVARQSEASLADTYMRAVLAVERSYWDMILSEEQLRSQKQGLDSALQLLRDTRKLRKFGYAIPLDVTIAKSGVASRREGVIVAESNLEASRDAMIRLIRPSRDPSKWDLLVVPVDQPKLIGEPKLDPTESIQLALQRRPDYYSAQLALENARRDVVSAENNALPSVNFVASWTQEGLGGQHHNSWTALGEGRFYTWSAGVTVELPLFLRSERAAVRQAKHSLERAEVSLRALEANVVLEVRGAIRNIRTSKARIEAARTARILAKQRLDATRKKVENGAAVPRDVLDDTAGLANAETAEVQAYVNYRLAVSSLRQATGTLLDDWLGALDPKVRQALDRLRSRE
jgi:outer membrane protein